MTRAAKNIIISILISVSLFLSYSQAQAAMSYFSHSNRDIDDNLIPFQPDTIYGNIHSNDFFLFTHPVKVFGMISTAQDRFIFGDGMTLDSIQFQDQPFYNIEQPMLPRVATTLRAGSQWINDGNGRYMTRVWLRGREGIVTYQYELGRWEPPLNLDLEDDEGIVNIRTFRPPAWGAIFINGQAEIFGKLPEILLSGLPAKCGWLIIYGIQGRMNVPVVGLLMSEI